jgi:KDO2-lipid IV(A) lauroyltransferase
MADMATLALPARLLLSFLRAIPTGLRQSLFRFLSIAFYHIIPGRRLITLSNIKKAFPDKEMDEIQSIAKGVYRNMAIVAAEFADLPFWTKETIGKIVEIDGLEHCTDALAKERGLLFFGAHFGNWELQAIATAMLLKPGTIIYRPLDNTVLENLVTWVRQSTGNIAISKKLAMLQMLRILKHNGIIGILIDQNMAQSEGVFVDYFGMSACTTTSLAQLALHTGAPVIPAFMIRQDNGHYRFILGPEVDVINTGDLNKDIVENTRNFTAIIEDMVRKYPDQWLWVHQRWKEKDRRDVKQADS